MLYRLVPTLIREGYVYIAESPLYEIESKGKTYFAYSDREKAEIVDSLNGAKASISRKERSRRERSGHDVADDDEPRDAPPHTGHARGR